MRGRDFDDWKGKALGLDLLATAISFGAQLRRAGREHVGPCPVCGGTDRFSINPTKGVWNCRGSGGGHDPIGLAMHCGGMSFLQAVEHLTGEPPPRSRSAGPLTPEQIETRDKRRAQALEVKAQRELERDQYEEGTHEAAMAIWYQAKPLTGSIAETYLNRRGIPMPADGWPLVLRWHPALPYPGGAKFPALVCRVDDVLGDLTAVWRIYLKLDGSGKATVDNAKLGLGPAAGGAVRIGGTGSKVGVCEGVETALGAWMLTGRKYPVWAALSTSGMTGIELPIGVREIVAFPDGDSSMRRKDGEFVPAIPAGRLAASTLVHRLSSSNIKARMAMEPPAGLDYLDLWRNSALEVA